MSDFKEDLKFGEVGEGIVLSKILADRNTQGVFDVRKIGRYQQYDIDFIWATHDDVFFIEVKHQKAFKNIFYETESFGKAGCMARSRATHFAIYLPEFNGKVLLITNKHLKEYLSTHRFEEKEVNDGVSKGKGYSIPITDLISCGVAWWWEDE